MAYPQLAFTGLKFIPAATNSTVMMSTAEQVAKVKLIPQHRGMNGNPLYTAVTDTESGIAYMNYPAGGYYYKFINQRYMGLIFYPPLTFVVIGSQQSVPVYISSDDPASPTEISLASLKSIDGYSLSNVAFINPGVTLRSYGNSGWDVYEVNTTTTTIYACKATIGSRATEGEQADWKAVIQHWLAPGI